MTDHKRIKGGPFLNEPGPIVNSGMGAVEPVELPEPQNADAPATMPEVDKLSFTTRPWAGVKDVFECNTCKTQRDLKDEITLHILSHVPMSEQEALLTKLTKEN